MTLNSVTLVGRVGGEVESAFFESGSVKATFTLAVNKQKRDTQPDWFNLELWGKTAQVAIDYVRKGSLIGISGSLKFETWTDRQSGAERSKPVIKVDRLELLGSKSDRQSPESGYADDEF